MADAPADSLAWALKALRDESRLGGYRVARRYLEGDHHLAFATEKFRETFARQFAAVVDNLCPAVVDAKSDRLVVEGVDADPTVEGSSDELAERAWGIWQRNRMDVRAPEVHREALSVGDGYALVWPNQADEAVIWPIPADEIVVEYDPNVPGRLLRAARTWQDEADHVHIDLYFDDRVERYITRTPKRKAMARSWTHREFTPYAVGEADLASGGVLEHRAGRVPIVHFPNGRYHAHGVSELASVIPLQDALNKTLCDMLVAQEFSAYPQRWATGIDPGPLDAQTGKPLNPPFDYGVDRMLTATAADGAADPKFGAFPTSDLRQYVEVQENLRAEVARVSGTPLHYLFITRGDFPSGEAMKSAEARFTRKVERLQKAWGNQWEDLLALALRLEGEANVKGEMFSLVWEQAGPGQERGTDIGELALSAQRLGLALRNEALTREQVDGLIGAALEGERPQRWQDDAQARSDAQPS